MHRNIQNNASTNAICIMSLVDFHIVCPKQFFPIENKATIFNLFQAQTITNSLHMTFLNCTVCFGITSLTVSKKFSTM